MLPLHCFNVVVQFEFEFFEFGFKLNLFEVFCKKKKNLSLLSPSLSPFSPNRQPGPVRSFFSLSARGPTSLPRPSLARAPAHPRLPLLCRRQAGPARRARPLPRDEWTLAESGHRAPRVAPSFLARTPRLGPRPYLRRPHPPGTLLSPIEPQPPPQFAQTLAAAIDELRARFHAAPPLRCSSSTSSPPRSSAR